MNDIVKLQDKCFIVMIPAEKIDKIVSEVATKLNNDYKEVQKPIFVGILNGAFMFLSDLLKKIDFTCELSFVKIASYEGTQSTGQISTLIGLNNDIEGRDVIIVEDIVDTGESIQHTVDAFRAKNPRSIKVCTLFFKPASYSKSIPIDYRAIEIGNEFIVGYGLDYDQIGRNLKDVYVVTNE